MPRMMADEASDHISLAPLIEHLDQLPEVMGPGVGEWAAWPPVRYAIWNALYWQPVAVRNLTGKSRFLRIVRQLGFLCRAVVEGAKLLFHSAFDDAEDHVLVLGTFNVSVDHEQKTSDYLFGDFLNKSAQRLSLPMRGLDFRWSKTCDIPFFQDNGEMQVRTAVPGMYIGYALSLLLRYRKGIGKAASELANIISPKLAGRFSSEDLFLIARKHLAIFEANRLLYRHCLTRGKVKVLIVTNPGGKWGEIAAAKELGIPVLELQHGAISATSPEYSYPPYYRSEAARMAIPNQILTFGQAWNDVVMQSGFWQPNQIKTTGRGMVDRTRSKAVSAFRPKPNIRLLFASQGDNHEHASQFLSALLAGANAQMDSEVNLWIKSHPLEGYAEELYSNLISSFGAQISFVENGQDAIEVMKNVDFVLSYHSTILAEALALGVPAVSICGGTSPDGFAGVIDIDGISDNMPHFKGADDLISFLANHVPTSYGYERLSESCRVFGETLYASGFTSRFQEAVDQVIDECCSSYIKNKK